MIGISHGKAKRYLRLATDGLLRDSQRILLEAHLRVCASCSAEAEKLNTLEKHLKRTFQARWDYQNGPSKNLISNICLQTGRIRMSNRIKIGLRFVTGIVLLVALAIAFNTFFSQLRKSPSSIATYTVTPTSLPATVTATLQPINGLIAFVSNKNGNDEIYTMHPDGSHVANLTNDPAGDFSPAWSPNGSRIAFVSERSGKSEIYVMNADGSGLSQLTQSLDGYASSSNAWSPDGQKIAFYSYALQDPNSGRLTVMNADGSGKIVLTNEAGSYWFLGWSPDNQKIIYQRQNLGPGGINPDIYGVYVVNADGTNGQLLLKSGNVSNIQWEDAQHFYAASGYSPWEIYRFNLDGTPPKLVALYDTPVSTWFGTGSDLNYVVKRFDTWDWYSIDGITKTHLSTWPSFSAKCQEPTRDLFLEDANNWLSPNGEYGLVTVYCDEGRTWFYYVNANGSDIKLLLNESIPMQDMGGASWSPDGQYIVVDLGENRTGNRDLYLIDIEKALQDPSIRPFQLTTDNALIYDTVWQP